MARGWGKREKTGPKIFAVGEVNRAAKRALESEFSDFWVEAEISQVKRSRSGHVYFTLSDEQEKAQLNVVLFSTAFDRIRASAERRGGSMPAIEDGARVRVRGNLTLYEASGSYQMIAKMVVVAGVGDLAIKFEEIRKRLEADGLMAPERKRPLPKLPRTVGVVTSVGSAAFQDIVRVAHARCAVRLVVADCQVQGVGSAASIVNALQQIQRLPAVDVIVLGRGGGAAEELWAFNHESVAREVARARVPIVCGVGHETDVTIAELVADVRASTPSNAAELAVPEQAVLSQQLDGLDRQLERAVRATVQSSRLELHRLEAKIGSPGRLLQHSRRRIDRSTERLRERVRDVLSAQRRLLEARRMRLREMNPRVRLERDRARLDALRLRLERAMRDRLSAERGRLVVGLRGLKTTRQLERARSRLSSGAGRLDALSPLRVLERGYAVALLDGKALTRAEDAKDGDELELRLHEGQLRARVLKR